MRPSFLNRALALASFVTLGAACSPSPPSTTPTVQPSATVAPRSSAEAGEPGFFPSKRFGLKLPLEDGTAWKIDDTRTPWLQASHPASSSTLLVRTWRDENRMTRDKCEARAREWRSLPTRENANIIETLPLDIPLGFDTRADVGLVPDPSKSSLFGFVLAFGGYAHKCFAFVYVTKDQGPGADERVADRLAKIVEGSLKKLRFESQLDPDVDHTPDLEGK